LVRRLAGFGIPQEDIAMMVACSEKTLRLHYREELDEGLEDAKVAVLGALMKKIQAGNTTAIIFYEKAMGGRKETIKEEITGPGGGPVMVGDCIQILPTCSEAECDQEIGRVWRPERTVLSGRSLDDQIRELEQEIQRVKANGKI
jgi:hypothetical protein